jgi:DNA-binding IscR family transcriptional regulator
MEGDRRMSIQQVFGTSSHLKVVLYLYNATKAGMKKVRVSSIYAATGLSYPTIAKVLADLRRAEIIAITGATKGKTILISKNRNRMLVWNLISELNKGKIIQVFG